MAPVQVDEEDISLFILPSLPTPLLRNSLWVAYRSTFESILQKVKPQSDGNLSRLDVAVELPPSQHFPSRTASYSDHHHVFQEIYTLFCLAATRTGVELDFPGGVDVRVFLISQQNSQHDTIPLHTLSGPVINIQTLVKAKRPYKCFYGVESEAGEVILQKLIVTHRQIQSSRFPETHRLQCGPYFNTSTHSHDDRDTHTYTHTPTHHRVIVGGTFDHLHLGHKLLLTATTYLANPTPESQTREIVIGMTTDALLANKKYPDHLESWETRQQRTHNFIESILAFTPLPIQSTTEHINNPGPNGRIVRVTYTPSPEQQDANQSKVVISYTSISDPYGPTITIENLTALAISAETRSGGKAVNEKRGEKGWKPLDIYEVGILDASVDEEEVTTEREGFEGKISSTEIRRRLAMMDTATNPTKGGTEVGKL